MREIEFSTMAPGACLHLRRLEEQAFFRARHIQYGWTTAWNKVLHIGLRQKGPEVSEIGSTWLENLNDIRALRPFSLAEIDALGGREAFVANAWSQETDTRAAGDWIAGMGGSGGARVYGETSPLQRVISIPWIIDPRLIFFRRDLLDQAGIDQADAFSTPETMFDTLSRLQASGVAYPLAMATGGLSIHNSACFIWGRGGHFRSEDYRKITLIEPEGRRGLLDFFRLARFIDPAIRGGDYSAANNLFFSGGAAVMLSGPWAMQQIKSHAAQVAVQVADHTGYALPPGVPFVGSTHLVIWRHALHEAEALRLIAHLTGTEVLSAIFQATGNFPARVQALQAAPFAGDADYAVAVECIRRGRMFRSARLWAGVEMRLNALFDQLWNDLFAQPDLDLEVEIERRIGALAARLEKTVLANW